MRMVVLLSFVAVWARLLASAQTTNFSDMPTYGSMAAGADRLVRRESAFFPRKSITAPGTLKGRWTSKSGRGSLIISQTYTNRAEAEKRHPPVYFIEDEFTLSIRSGTNRCDRHFEAAYGAFRIYGVDVNGDGVDEIVVERGEGRGTFVYVQKLEILTVSGSSIETIFEADLNGYIWNPDTDDPVSWERAYVWKNGKQNAGLELELRLIPPAVIPKYCGSEATLFVLQHPKLLFRLNREQERFEIVDEVFAPLGKKATSHRNQ